jgi:methylated-DNA-protein-cysteine methyltransferase-like protein
LNDFFRRVYDIVTLIPPGKVTTYGQIARWLGSPRSARIVGWAMRSCPPELPWQRVVLSSGDITGGEFAPERRRRLEAEGITFLPDGRVDLARSGWAAPPVVDRTYFPD